MSKESRLIKNTLILFIGVVGTRLISFIMLPFYTDWLTIDEYGVIDIFNTIVSMCVPILTLQVEQAVFRFMIDDKTLDDYRLTVSNGFLCLAVVLVIVDIPMGIYLITIKAFTYALYLVAINLQCVYVMFQQIIRGEGKNQIYTANSILLAFSNVCFSILFIRILGKGALGYVGAFCLAHICAVIFMIAQSNIVSIFRISAIQLKKIKELLAYSLPMIVNNVSWWILNASDKLILNFFVGISANGIFAAAGKIPGLVTTVYTVFQMAWQESTSREKGTDIGRFYSDVFRKLYAVISYFVVCMLLLGNIVFNVLISSKFEEAYKHVPILTVALLFLCISQFYGGIYVGLKRAKELGWTSAVAAIVNLLIDIILVKKLGIYAASLSTLLAYLVLCIIRVLSSKSLCTIAYKSNELIVTGFLIFASFLIAYSSSLLLHMAAFIVATIVFLEMYKDIVIDITGMLKRKFSR